VIRRMLLVGFVILASCGGSSDMEPRASRDLTQRMSQVRAAVEEGDRLGARAAIRDLERAVGEWRSRGLVSETRAEEILSAAEDVLVQLSLLPAATPSPGITSPSPFPTPTDEKPPKHDEPPGHGYGHGDEHGQKDGHGEE
jgi:hypothetical protein